MLYHLLDALFIKVADCDKFHKSRLVRPAVKALYSRYVDVFYDIHIADGRPFGVDAIAVELWHAVFDVKSIRRRVSGALLLYDDTALFIQLGRVKAHAVDPVAKNAKNVL